MKVIEPNSRTSIRTLLKVKPSLVDEEELHSSMLPQRNAWRKSKGAEYERFLKVEGWSSGYKSVNNLLLRLARRSKSESTKKQYLWHLYKFSQFTGMTPSQLVKLTRKTAETLIQKYTDTLSSISRSYANTAITALKTFFVANGYTRNRALEIERYYQPKRCRTTMEYIPTKAEVYKMADAASSLRDRAIILMLFGTGLRNSTLRALRYRDVKQELCARYDVILIPVYPEMKEVIPSACKGNVSYYTFLHPEGVQALRLYLKDREERYGGISDEEPLFCTEYNQIPKHERRKTPLTARELQLIVKEAARKAGIKEWRLVHPHALRKTYESVLRSQLLDGSYLDVKTQEFLWDTSCLEAKIIISIGQKLRV